MHFEIIGNGQLSQCHLNNKKVDRSPWPLRYSPWNCDLHGEFWWCDFLRPEESSISRGRRGCSVKLENFSFSWIQCTQNEGSDRPPQRGWETATFVGFACLDDIVWRKSWYLDMLQQLKHNDARAMRESSKVHHCSPAKKSKRKPTGWNTLFQFTRCSRQLIPHVVLPLGQLSPKDPGGWCSAGAPSGFCRSLMPCISPVIDGNEYIKTVNINQYQSISINISISLFHNFKCFYQNFCPPPKKNNLSSFFFKKGFRIPDCTGWLRGWISVWEIPMSKKSPSPWWMGRPSLPQRLGRVVGLFTLLMFFWINKGGSLRTQFSVVSGCFFNKLMLLMLLDWF